MLQKLTEFHEGKQTHNMQEQVKNSDINTAEEKAGSNKTRKVPLSLPMLSGEPYLLHHTTIYTILVQTKGHHQVRTP